MCRTNHLDASIRLFFDKSRTGPLDLRNLNDISSAISRADSDPDVIYIIGGPDAEEAVSVITRLLSEIPSVREALIAVRSTATSL